MHVRSALRWCRPGPRSWLTVLATCGVFIAACGSDTASTGTESAQTISASQASGSIASSEATTPPTTSAQPAPVDPSASTTSQVTTASIAPRGPCDPALAVAIATEATTAAKLTNPDARWEEPTADAAFVDRTTDNDRFARALGFNCSWSAAQLVDGGQRLALAAWTGDRLSMVIQATDGPSVPFRQDRTFDLLIEAPDGELIADDTWAGTMSTGETIIVLTRNVSNSGVTAKSWLAEYVFLPDEDTEGETPTEQMALPALRAAGGRNVYVGEPSHGSPIASLSLVSPAGDVLDVSVGPDDQFDPFGVVIDYSSAEPFDDDLDGTLVRFSDLDPTVEYITSAAAFNCNGFGWLINASTGDTAETRNFIVELIEALDCIQPGT